MSNYDEIISPLKEKNVRLVAVSKTRPIEAIMALYALGQRDFGENRVQELCDKQAVLPQDIRWHLIGHLQTNKVKYIAEWISLIHSVDSLALLKEINKYAAKNNRIIPCLLQTYIAQEETKFGLSEEEILALLDSDEFAQLHNVEIHGLMGMATNTDNTDQIRKEFEQLARFFTQLKSTRFSKTNTFKELSMGMSSDFPIAVAAGATMVRIGSSLFSKSA